MRATGSTRARGRGDRKREPLAPLRPARDDGQARLIPTKSEPLETLELYLARHGETEWSLSGRHTGSTDLPLTERGEEKAEALGHRLGGVSFDAVYSSPMLRALRTAELAGFPHPKVTDLLKEVNYGSYEGLTSKQIHESDPGWELYKDGCPGGETPAQIYARACEFIELAAGRGEARVLAFAHGHILRAVAVAWIAADIMLAARLMLDVATVNVLRNEADRGRLIALWNST